MYCLLDTHLHVSGVRCYVQLISCSRTLTVSIIGFKPRTTIIKRTGSQIWEQIFIYISSMPKHICWLYILSLAIPSISLRSLSLCFICSAMEIYCLSDTHLNVSGVRCYVRLISCSRTLTVSIIGFKPRTTITKSTASQICDLIFIIKYCPSD